MLRNCLGDKLVLPFEVWELWPDLNLIKLKPSSWLEWRSEEGGGRKNLCKRQQRNTVAL